MKQIWTILRKDARHHWPEIAASLAILATFAWAEIYSWTHSRNAAYASFSLLTASFLPGLVNALVPLSWIFLIVRVVQGEPLVGDRQFWVTRPYDWKVLLAAKVLFIVTFINLPCFAMDAFLLARAGFHPAHYVVGLLWMQLMWILFICLPAGALASVTRTIPQMLLALLLVALFMIGMIALSQVIPNSNFSSGSDWWTGFLFIATTVTIILLQYSRRRTAAARWLIAGLFAALALIMVLTPYRSLIARAYPLSQGDVPVEVKLLPAQTNRGSYYDQGGEVSIQLPLSISQLPKDTFVDLDGMIATLTNANGVRWDSGWTVQARNFFADSQSAEISFQVDRRIFDQLKSAPVSAHLLLAFSTYHDTNQRQFVVPQGEFQMPDVGLCSASGPAYFHSIRCRTPLRRPRFLLITSDMASSTCPWDKQDSPAPPGLLAHDSVRYGDSDPAEMGISPLHEVDIYLSDWNTLGTRFSNPGICPGTPLTLSNPEFVGRSRVELQINNLSLTDYKRGSGKITFR